MKAKILLLCLMVGSALCPLIGHAQSLNSGVASAGLAPQSTRADPSLIGCPAQASALALFQEGLNHGQQGQRAQTPACAPYREGYTTGRNLMAYAKASAQPSGIVAQDGFTSFTIEATESSGVPIANIAAAPEDLGPSPSITLASPSVPAAEASAPLAGIKTLNGATLLPLVLGKETSQSITERPNVGVRVGATALEGQRLK